MFDGDALTGFEAAGLNHAGHEPAPPDDDVLEIGMNCIEDEAGLARLGELEDRAVLEVELVARREALHVQATDGEVFPDYPGRYRVPLGLELLEKFEILNGDGPVGAAVLVVVVAVADEAIHGHLGRLDNVFGYAPW